MPAVLVIGSGGREHAIVHALNKSKRVDKVYCAPSNAGIGLEAENVDIGVNEFEKIANFLALHKDVSMTVVGPDNPLVEGLVDFLENLGHRVFGPRKNAAIIEGSKIFSKKLMQEYKIPTADYAIFDDYETAASYIETVSFPTVIKADGLAFGKGVLICPDLKTSKTALKSIMIDKVFGNNNTKTIVESFLSGREVTLLAFTDGKTVKPMLSSQDHKRAFDGDRGLNTGGMGAFAPSPYFTDELLRKTCDEIIYPTITALNARGCPFKGVLYFGLMICNNQPFVIEYNARFGDPEAQAILPLLESDLYDIFDAIIDERLSEIEIKWKNQYAVNVVVASGGYPGSFEKNKPITIGDVEDAEIYHAGTSNLNNELVSSAGRVLSVTAIGKDIEAARKKAYKAIKQISFDGMFYRSDIGVK
jgi:phosphoribosylamine--glycine ligase